MCAFWQSRRLQWHCTVWRAQLLAAPKLALERGEASGYNLARFDRFRRTRTLIRIIHFLTALWPGVPDVWRRGGSRGLLIAVLFSAVVNAALIITFVYPLPQLGPAWVFPGAAVLLVLFFWISAMLLVGSTEADEPRSDPQADAALREAQTHYLKGDWDAAEKTITTLLSRQPSDVEARLLLACVHRRAGRLKQAAELLDSLSRDPGADHWKFEINHEISRLKTPEDASTTPERRAA